MYNKEKGEINFGEGKNIKQGWSYIIKATINMGRYKNNLTCLLTEEEKIKMCEIVSKSKADFIKTSTGFSSAGATQEDIIILKKYMDKGKGIKAAGGIASFEDAEKFIQNGATRLGTSRLIKIVKEKWKEW